MNRMKIQLKNGKIINVRAERVLRKAGESKNSYQNKYYNVYKKIVPTGLYGKKISIAKYDDLARKRNEALYKTDIDELNNLSSFINKTYR